MHKTGAGRAAARIGAAAGGAIAVHLDRWQTAFFHPAVQTGCAGRLLQQRRLQGQPARHGASLRHQPATGAEVAVPRAAAAQRGGARRCRGRDVGQAAATRTVVVDGAAVAAAARASAGHRSLPGQATQAGGSGARVVTRARVVDGRPAQKTFLPAGL